MGRTTIVVGLGANLGDRLERLRRAVEQLAECEGVTILKRSSVVGSAPVGGPPQPDFYNAAVLLEMASTPAELLARTSAIEARLGRVRMADERFAPRPIDIDLLWAPGAPIDEPNLQLPHPRLCERAFALQPLLELVPDARDPRTGMAYSDLPAASHVLRKVANL